ncbi:MAG: TAXI family TRAP transporter solute-binding subunit [Syntrophaceae bacterium]|nr:TAXI family TRAP transporter solute-binding subunit [Syntrophaceae bacterium]
MKRFVIFGIIALFILGSSTVWAQKSVRLSIATGGTGGVYYPLGGGMANIISKYIPYAEATAEVTTASVDNCRLVGAGKAELALIMADTGWDAFQGRAQFKEKVPLRTLAVLYPNNMHIVTIEGRGIDKVTDLKGKRVSTGAPGSGTEIMALRVLEAFGMDPDKDMTRDKLGVSESAGALKDRKIDAFFWVGGLPTAAITDVGATPGLKIKLIGHVDALSKMREKYGPLYVRGTIPAKTYPGQDADVPITVVWNLLVCNENMKGDVAYDIIRTLFERKPELVTVHKDAGWLALEPQVGGSPIPFHPGAIRYFKEKGITVK